MHSDSDNRLRYRAANSHNSASPLHGQNRGSWNARVRADSRSNRFCNGQRLEPACSYRHRDDLPISSYESGALIEAQQDLERLRKQLRPKNQLKEEEFLFQAKRTAVGSNAHARFKKVLVNEWLLNKNSWAGQLRILAHELTHVMQMDLVDGRSITSDQWIREGLADWVGYKVADALGAELFTKSRERVLASITERKFYQTFPNLSQLAIRTEWLTWSRTLGNSATYGQAFIAVDFLIAEKGVPAVLNYFGLFKTLNNRGRNFTTAFGESSAAFEERFAKHLAGLLRR